MTEDTAKIIERLNDVSDAIHQLKLEMRQSFGYVNKSIDELRTIAQSGFERLTETRTDFAGIIERVIDLEMEVKALKKAIGK